MEDINRYSFASGRIMGEDNKLYNLVDLLKSISNGGGGGGGDGTVDAHMQGHDGTDWRNVAVDTNGRQLISGKLVNSKGATINIADGYYGNGSSKISNNAEVLFCGISDGQQVSGAVGIGGSMVAGIIIPAGYNGGNITFEATRDVLSNTPWYPLYDSNGTLVTVAAAAGRHVALTGYAMQAIATCMYLRLKTTTPVSGSTDARTLYLVVKG